MIVKELPVSHKAAICKEPSESFTVHRPKSGILGAFLLLFPNGTVAFDFDNEAPITGSRGKGAPTTSLDDCLTYCHCLGSCQKIAPC